VLRIEENPPPRWPEERPLEDELGKWWVVRTKSRNEKALAWDLVRLDISYYLPQVTRRTVRKDNGKPRKSVMCLFPGYISVADFPRHKQNLYRTNRIYKGLEVIDQERFVEELNQVKKALEYAREVETSPGPAVGQRVLIIDGPMAGLRGIVSSLDNRPDRVHLNVEMFQRSVSIKVPREFITPADEGSIARISSA